LHSRKSNVHEDLKSNAKGFKSISKAQSQISKSALNAKPFQRLKAGSQASMDKEIKFKKLRDKEDAKLKKCLPFMQEQFRLPL